jgi:hypothetical protein
MERRSARRVRAIGVIFIFGLRPSQQAIQRVDHVGRHLRFEQLFPASGSAKTLPDPGINAVWSSSAFIAELPESSDVFFDDVNFAFRCLDD